MPNCERNLTQSYHFMVFVYRKMSYKALKLICFHFSFKNELYKKTTRPTVFLSLRKSEVSLTESSINLSILLSPLQDTFA